MDTRRALSFMMRSRMLNAEQFEEARQILRDIDSLDSHTAFLFDKINFLMDATVGFININQNKIIKIFSVASVALLPPTLIASIYGMNFKHMPELDQAWGYPLRAGLMAASVAAPFIYFRRKGWLGRAQVFRRRRLRWSQPFGSQRIRRPAAAASRTAPRPRPSSRGAGDAAVGREAQVRGTADHLRRRGEALHAEVEVPGQEGTGRPAAMASWITKRGSSSAT
jgi:hypothetical protein